MLVEKSTEINEGDFNCTFENLIVLSHGVAYVDRCLFISKILIVPLMK